MSFKAFVWAWDQDIPNGDYQHVLLALANIAPGRQTFASVPYIARQTRRSPRKVRAALEWLREAGMITLTPRPGRTDMIRMNIPRDFMVIMPEEDDDLEDGVRGRPRKTPAPLHGEPSQNPPPRGADEPIEPKRTFLVDAQAREPFDAFWSKYPLKKSKDAARLAFSKAMRRLRDECAGDGDPLATILQGVDRYVEEIARTGVLVKHPATWLNGGCWNDEPDTNGSQTDGRRDHPSRPDRAAERTAAVFRPMAAGAEAALDRRRGRWRIL